MLLLAVTQVTYDQTLEKANRAEIRSNVPHLNDWTFGVLWNVAYQRAMM
jgi:hypothetical protein